ncbi:hypothetical protein DA102_034070 [Sinorhizobium meliloti]|nr:hypothetical protein DA102_034070 [Sinorhizobium meliloti]
MLQKLADVEFQFDLDLAAKISRAAQFWTIKFMAVRQTRPKSRPAVAGFREPLSAPSAIMRVASAAR